MIYALDKIGAADVKKSRYRSIEVSDLKLIPMTDIERKRFGEERKKAMRDQKFKRISIGHLN